MAKRRKAAKRKGERIIYGMTAQVNRAAFPAGTDTAVIADDAIRRFYRTGEETEGVHLIGRWRNPDKKFGNPNWKRSDDDGQTLTGDDNSFFATILQRLHAAPPPADRSFAAKKGAETRRRKRAEKLALKEKRSAAARKGWKTRRRNARRKARAAKKGKKS